METLFIACGNPLRGDDGVAFEAVRWLAEGPGRAFLAVQQLTPELAAEMSSYDRVVFVDASTAATSVTLAPVEEPAGLACLPHGSLSHVARAAEVVVLARELFGFHGEALECGIPARDFRAGDPVSPEALRNAERAATALEGLLAF